MRVKLLLKKNNLNELNASSNTSLDVFKFKWSYEEGVRYAQVFQGKYAIYSNSCTNGS